MKEYPSEEKLRDMSPGEKANEIVGYLQQQADIAASVVWEEKDRIIQEADFIVNKDYKKGYIRESKAVRDARNELKQARNEFDAWTKARSQDYEAVGITDKKDTGIADRNMSKFNGRLELMRRIESGKTDITTDEMKALIGQAGIIDPKDSNEISRTIRQAIEDDIKFQVFMASEWENYSDGMRDIKIKGKVVRVTGRKEVEDRRDAAEAELKKAQDKQEEFIQKEAEILQSGGNLKQAEREYLQTMDTLGQIYNFLTAPEGGFVTSKKKLESAIGLLEMMNEGLSDLTLADQLAREWSNGELNWKAQNRKRKYADGVNRYQYIIRGMELPERRLMAPGVPDALRRAEVYIQMAERDDRVWQDTPNNVRMTVLRVVDVLHGREPRKIEVKIVEATPASPEPPPQPSEKPEPIPKSEGEDSPATFTAEQIAALPADERARHIVSGEFTAVQLRDLNVGPRTLNSVDQFYELSLNDGKIRDLLNSVFKLSDESKGKRPVEELPILVDGIGRRLGETLADSKVNKFPINSRDVIVNMLDQLRSEDAIIEALGQKTRRYLLMLDVISDFIKPQVRN